METIFKMNTKINKWTVRQNKIVVSDSHVIVSDSHVNITAKSIVRKRGFKETCYVNFFNRDQNFKK